MVKLIMSEPKAKKRIEVVGAIIVENGLIFAAQRGLAGALPGMWEFPGGKVEVGESPESALVREIDEELGCVIEVGEQVTTTTHEYDFAVVTLTTFQCRLLQGSPVSNEHSAQAWLTLDRLGSVEWAPADIPAVELVRARLV